MRAHRPAHPDPSEDIATPMCLQPKPLASPALPRPAAAQVRMHWVLSAADCGCLRCRFACASVSAAKPHPRHHHNPCLQPKPPAAPTTSFPAAAVSQVRLSPAVHVSTARAACSGDWQQRALMLPQTKPCPAFFTCSPPPSPPPPSPSPPVAAASPPPPATAAPPPPIQVGTNILPLLCGTAADMTCIPA